jgi:pimeloyl-ACP methyl ester carboxylesterase
MSSQPEDGATGGSGAASRPGRLTWRELRLTRSAPRPFDGLTSGWVPVEGLRLHVRQRTWPAAAPDCVLVHGLAVSHRYLTPTAAWLGRPVAIPDLPGFGLSDKPARVFAVSDHARLLAAWLDARGRGPVCLLANSYGCQVAVDLAVRRPDLVAALVLVGPTVDPAAASIAGQVGRWARDLYREDPRQAVILARDIRDAGPRRIAGTLRDSVRDRIETKLPLVTAPTLLVRGARDAVAPARWLAAAARLMPDATTVQIPGAAHNAVTTAGAQVARASDRFLRRVLTSGEARG